MSSGKVFGNIKKAGDRNIVRDNRKLTKTPVESKDHNVDGYKQVNVPANVQEQQMDTTSNAFLVLEQGEIDQENHEKEEEQEVQILG